MYYSHKFFKSVFRKGNFFGLKTQTMSAQSTQENPPPQIIKEVNHTNKLSIDMEQLFDNSTGSNVKFKKDDIIFSAHRAFLATRGEYFKHLLFGGLRESASNVVNLGDDTPLLAFQEILHYLYTGRICFRPNQTYDQILEILALSHKYQLAELQESVANYVVESLLNPDNMLEIYQFNELYEYEKLKEACEKLMDGNPEQVLRRLDSLSANVVYRIISRDSFCAKEELIFSSVKEWIEWNCESTEDRNLVLSGVRLHLISREILISKVRKSRLFSEGDILDTIEIQDEKDLNDRYSQRMYFSMSGVNIATPNHGAKVIRGKVDNGSLETNLLSGNSNIDLGSCTYHLIDDENGIVIQLGYMSRFNYIRLLIPKSEIFTLIRLHYSIHISKDQKTWTEVAEKDYHDIGKWKEEKFDSVIAKFIRLKGYCIWHSGRNTLQKKPLYLQSMMILLQ